MRKTSTPDVAIDIDLGGFRPALGARRLRALGESVLRRQGQRQALLSLAFVSHRRIAAMNRRHLGHHGPTDVITFALGRAGSAAPVVGDIYVAPDVVRTQARRLGLPVREELARVVIHGILHALGMRHPENGRRERSPMWQRQERLLRLARREGLL